LKPGARLLVLEFMCPTVPRVLQSTFSLWSKRLLPRIGAAISKHGGAYSYLPASVHGFLTRREFEQLLREAGGSREQALQAWVQNFYDSIERDRATGIPNVEFTLQPPTTVTIGQLPGLRYEFASRQSNNILYERTIGYVASDNDTLYVIVTGLINGDPAGTFSDSADLQEFQPHLDRIVAGLNLPVDR